MADTAIPTRPLGKTGLDVSILGLGGWHIRSVKDDAESIKIMHTAIDEGINFFDNAWDYHDGAAEEIMGKALGQGGWRGQSHVDDQGLCPRRQGRSQTVGRKPETIANRCHRRLAIPRDQLRQRSDMDRRKRWSR